MKLLVGVFLSLALLESVYCAGLTSSDEGNYTETHTSSSWGYGAGVDANIGLEGGYRDGHATLGSKKHLGVNVEGHKEYSQKELHQTATSPPNFGSSVGYPYGIPNNPANGCNGCVGYTQYAPQPLAPQFAPQWPQYAQQPPVYYEYVPQYAYSPQYAPQNTPQYVPQSAPQYAPQNAPQYAPQNTPQYVPQGAPHYAPHNVPQYAPRRAPHYATPTGAPDTSQQTINEEYAL